jgi:hypothetical protein
LLASNVLLFSTYPLCALALYALARRWVAAPAAFLAGAAYAFCGLRYGALYHLHQLGVFWLPLAILLTERWLEHARARDAVLLTAAPPSPAASRNRTGDTSGGTGRRGRPPR